MTIGDRVGKLTVEYILKRGSKRVGGWGREARCRCDCGEKVYRKLHRLKLAKRTGLMMCCVPCRRRLAVEAARRHKTTKDGRHGLEKDLTGRRIGHLTVIRRLPMRGTGHRPMWLCLCVCGDVAATSTKQLQRIVGGCSHRHQCLCGKWFRRTESDFTGLYCSSACRMAAKEARRAGKDVMLQVALRAFKRDIKARRQNGSLGNDHGPIG